MLEEFKNATLFPRLGLPTILIRHENGTFLENVPQTGAIYISKPTFPFEWTENNPEKELFENDDVTIITWFPWPSFPQTQIQWPVLVAFLNSSRISVDGKHLMNFQTGTSVLKFLQPKVVPRLSFPNDKWRQTGKRASERGCLRRTLEGAYDVAMWKPKGHRAGCEHK